MIAGDDHEGVVKFSRLLESCERPSQMIVEVLDFEPVVEDFSPYVRMVGQRAGQACVFQPLPGLLPSAYVVALVGLGGSQPEKERLALVPSREKFVEVRSVIGRIQSGPPVGLGQFYAAVVAAEDVPRPSLGAPGAPCLAGRSQFVARILEQ